MDRAAKSPLLSVLSRPWNISSLPRMKETEKESEREGGKMRVVCERERERENQRKKRKQNSVYGSGCLWNNFPYQWNCMSPVGKGIWFFSIQCQWKRRTWVKAREKKAGKRKREALAGLYISNPITGTVVSGSFLVRKHTNHHSVILPEPVWSIQ